MIEQLLISENQVMNLDEDWSCPSCTFFNHSSLLVCELCNTNKPQQYKRNTMKKIKTENESGVRCVYCSKLSNGISKICQDCQWPLFLNGHQQLLIEQPKQKTQIKQPRIQIQPIKNKQQLHIETELLKCPQCLFQNSRENLTCISCQKLLTEQNTQFGQCPMCNVMISQQFLQSHFKDCQKNEELIQQLEKELTIPIDEFVCCFCKAQLKIDGNCFTLQCNHTVCINCLKDDLQMKIQKELVYQLKCKKCQVNIGYNTIKYVVTQKHFINYTECMHKNLKTEDQNLILRPCKGLTLESLDPLPQAESKQKLEAFVSYYINHPESRDKKIKPCQAILSYHKVEDVAFETYTCVVCRLEMCVNGCQSVHRGISCHQYNQQQLIFTSFMNYFDLDPSFLDQRGNRDYAKATISVKKTINGQPYFPPHGFKQYGINLKGKYQNDEWLGKGPKAWVVMYHGVKNAHSNIGMQPVKKPVKKVLNKYQPSQQLFQKYNDSRKTILKSILETTLKAGGGQGFQGAKCIRTGKQVGVGIYGSPHVDVCSNGYARYSTSVAGIGFSVVIKCRVRPQAIRVVGKPSDLGRKQAEYQNDYWVINNSNDIRPYAFLLKRNK